MSNIIKIKTDKDIIDIDYDKALNSLYIKDLIFQNGDDYIVTFPDKYLEAVNYYVNFIEYDFCMWLEDYSKLKLYFEFESYIHDTNFFDSLIEYILSEWDNISFSIYDNFCEDIKRDIFIRFSLPLLPDKYITNVNFINSYLKYNENKSNYILTGRDIQFYTIYSRIIKDWWENSFVCHINILVVICQHNDNYEQFIYDLDNDEFLCKKNVKHWDDVYC